MSNPKYLDMSKVENQLWHTLAYPNNTIGDWELAQLLHPVGWYQNRIEDDPNATILAFDLETEEFKFVNRELFDDRNSSQNFVETSEFGAHNE
jgi:hypothetical protein